MSHYTVAVFLRDGTSPRKAVAELLAPYAVDVPVEKALYMTKAEIIQDGRERLQSDYKKEYCAWKKHPKAYEAEHSDPDHIKYVKSIPERLKWSDEEIYEDYLGDDKEDLLAKGLLNEAGDRLSAFNPDFQWDDYVIGGRWNGRLILKHGKTGIRGPSAWCKKPSKNYDGAYVRDIDFESMRKQKRKDLTPYDEILKDELFGEETLADYRDEEEYIQRNITFHTYAVVTPDGKWHATGKVGWFGFTSDTPEEKRSWDQEYHERFLKPALENNWYMVIVDCHI